MLTAIHKLFRRRYVYRDAATGRYVSKLYAMFNRSTVVRERVK